MAQDLRPFGNNSMIRGVSLGSGGKVPYVLSGALTASCTCCPRSTWRLWLGEWVPGGQCRGPSQGPTQGQSSRH